MNDGKNDKAKTYPHVHKVNKDNCWYDKKNNNNNNNNNKCRQQQQYFNSATMTMSCVIMSM